MAEGTILTQPLWDKETVATAGTTELVFFSTPAGQAGKDTSDTNMTTASQLPGGHSFTAQGMRVLPDPGASLADLQAVLKGAVVELVISGRTIFQTPIENTSGGRGVVGAATNGQPDATAVTRFGVPITIDSGESFHVSIKWKTAPAPVSAVPLTVVLEGNLTRPTS